MMDLGTAVAYLDLDLTAFNTGIESAVSAVEGLQNVLSGGGFAWSDFFVDAGKLAVNFGNQLTQSVTAPLANFGKSAIDSYIDYESAFTGVKKTLDTGNRSFEETQILYQELSDAIEDMATRTASTAPEIAAVAEIAGQLGISAEDLMQFTEVMVMLGDTTNLSSAEAAEALAQFINITGTSKSDIDRLGASIVDLGNHFATNESDIVRMATRLASAGTIAGLTERDILALSTAMSSVGIKAEAGGSSMAQTLAQIETNVQKYIEGGEGNEGAIAIVEKLAEVSGMTAEGFAKTWLDDPMFAISEFLRGLGNVEEFGESTVLVLEDLGMTGIRQSNMLKALGLAGDVLIDSIKTSNRAWEDNTALTNEAELRYGTLESQLNQLGQEWEIMKREIAEMLIPILRDLMDIVRDLIDWWRGLSDDTKESIVQFLEFAAAVGPILMVVGKLSSGLGLVMKVFEGIIGIGSFVSGFFTGRTGEVADFAGEAIKTGGALEKLKGIVSTVWEVIKKAGTMLFSGFKKLVGFVVEVGKAFVQHLGPVLKAAGGVTALVGGIVTAVQGFFDILKDGFSWASEAKMAIGLALAAFGAWLLGVPGLLAAAIAAGVFIIANFVALIVRNWDSIKEGFSNAMEFIKEWFSHLWVSLKVFAQELWARLTEFFGGIWDAVTGIFSDIFGEVGHFVQNMVRGAAEFFDELFNGAHGFLGNLFSAVMDFIGNTASRVGDFISSIFYALGDFFQNIVTKTFEFFGNIFKHLGQFLADNFGAVGEFFGNILWNFGDFISNIGEFLGNLIHMVFEKVGDFFLNIGERTSELFSNLKEKALNFFVEHGEDITHFFSNIFGKIGDFFGNVFGKIGEWFGNIRQNIANWFDNLIGWFKSLPGYFFDAGAKMFSGLWDGIKSIWNKITGWVVEKMQWLGDKLFGWIPGFNEGNMFGTLFGGSHANGLDYVPYDGYVAELHKGERVLTKAENKEYNSGSTGSGGDTFNFYNTKPDPYEYARQMKRAKREMAFG